MSSSLPDPSNWPAFEAAITQINQQIPPVWDPIRNRRRPWFSVTKLRKKFSGRPFCVVS
jgi:hypothetical protein